MNFFFKHISLGDRLELGCESKLAAVPAIWEANESTDLEKVIHHLQAPVSSSVNWGQWYLPLRFPITPCSSLSWVINTSSRTSLVAQWLRLHAPSAGVLSLIPGQGTRSHMP